MFITIFARIISLVVSLEEVEEIAVKVRFFFAREEADYIGIKPQSRGGFGKKVSKISQAAPKYGGFFGSRSV